MGDDLAAACEAALSSFGILAHSGIAAPTPFSTSSIFNLATLSVSI